MVMRTVALALSFATPYAFAHGGHDHSHWTSGAIHAVWIGASLAVIALAVVMLKKRTALKNEKTQKEEG